MGLPFANDYSITSQRLRPMSVLAHGISKLLLFLKLSPVSRVLKYSTKISGTQLARHSFTNEIIFALWTSLTFNTAYDAQSQLGYFDPTWAIISTVYFELFVILIWFLLHMIHMLLSHTVFENRLRQNKAVLLSIVRRNVSRDWKFQRISQVMHRFDRRVHANTSFHQATFLNTIQIWPY